MQTQTRQQHSSRQTKKRQTSCYEIFTSKAMTDSEVIDRKSQRQRQITTAI